MTTEPACSMGFRPTLSMINYSLSVSCEGDGIVKAHMRTMAGTVLTKKTTPVTPVASKAVVPPVKPRLTKMFEA